MSLAVILARNAHVSLQDVIRHTTLTIQAAVDQLQLFEVRQQAPVRREAACDFAFA